MFFIVNLKINEIYVKKYKKDGSDNNNLCNDDYILVNIFPNSDEFDYSNKISLMTIESLSVFSNYKFKLVQSNTKNKIKLPTRDNMIELTKSIMNSNKSDIDKYNNSNIKTSAEIEENN